MPSSTSKWAETLNERQISGRLQINQLYDCYIFGDKLGVETLWNSVIDIIVIRAQEDYDSYDSCGGGGNVMRGANT